ncbi:MAG TPA: TRAP transporter small permease [Pseudogracilibacillus sp.]|nr:TRAP transporter small permease [Pseudogracilibacillus sp.]
MVKIVESIWHLLLHMQRVILVICSLLLALGLGLTVIMRYILKIDLFGLEELIVIPAFWLYFIGASFGTYKKSHISAELVSVYIKSKKVKIYIEFLTSLVTTILCFIVSYWSIQFFVWSFLSGAKSSAWKIPQYIPHSAILVGFLLMSLYFIVQFISKSKELVALYK